jgi:prolyl 4-hydroxylase
MRKPRLITALIVVLAACWAIADLAQPAFKPVEYPGFLTDAECDAVVEAAKQKGLKKSTLYELNGEPSYDATIRNSEQAWLYPEDDDVAADVAAVVAAKVAALTGLPVSHQEAVQVVHYTAGGLYKPHYDALRAWGPFGGIFDRNPRLYTVLVYLTDDFVGGETHFPRIGYTVKPEKGKAVLFQNVTRMFGGRIKASQHGGNPVESGEKWIANVWVGVAPPNGASMGVATPNGAGLRRGL